VMTLDFAIRPFQASQHASSQARAEGVAAPILPDAAGFSPAR
jgi:hypothetical protein